MTINNLIEKQERSVKFWKTDLLKSLYELQEKVEAEIKSIEANYQPKFYSTDINFQEIIWKSAQLNSNKNFLGELKQKCVAARNDMADAQDLFENAQRISQEGADAHYHESRY